MHLRGTKLSNPYGFVYNFVVKQEVDFATRGLF